MLYRFLLLALPLVTGGAGLGHAQAVNANRDGLALAGYDPVSYQTAAAPQKGKAEFTATHEGVTYRFASAENRDTFRADPARYVPAYGGFCAYGMSKGYRAKVDPEAFTIVAGRLYLNYDQDVRARWLKDVPGYIAKADPNWERIRNDPAN